MSDEPITFANIDQVASLAIAGSSGQQLVTLKPDGKMVVLAANGEHVQVDPQAAMWLYAAVMHLAQSGQRLTRVLTECPRCGARWESRTTN